MMERTKRACGNCMLCCKLPSIAELNKPQGQWCSHAKPGKGCNDYSNRPSPCRGFYCIWTWDERLGPEWHPSEAKFYLYLKANGNVVLMADPSSPLAWRHPKYYDTLRQASVSLLAKDNSLRVICGQRSLFLLPDREIEIPGQYENKNVFLRVTRKFGDVRYEIEVAD
jgi:hypothetical protein